jgi:hypothetical protein
MALTWGTVLERIRRFLSDNLSTERFSDDELCDAWIDAQDDLVRYVARQKTVTIDAESTAYNLPDDLYRVLYVKNSDGYTMIQLVPHEPSDDDLWEGNYWYLTDTQIVFTSELTEEVTLVYKCYYPAPSVTETGQPILIPRWAVQACMYYVAAQATERQVIKDPQLRQHAQRTDAGNPKDNPFLAVAKYLLERYRQVIYDHIGDSQERATWPSSYQ